jgi:hypothetical protein
MPRAGRGYPGCASCVNRELDPFQCATCSSESNWEGFSDEGPDVDSVEDMDLDEFRDRYGDLE